ncbi:MAG: ABC transporter permease [Planctomycetes bacterium]|nr:ABC transporter permease [Planctomycetota bacterium]
MFSGIHRLGAFLIESTHGAGYGIWLLLHTLMQVPAIVRTKSRKDLYRQMFICGIQTIPVTVVVSIFTGMILALNGGLSLEQIGQEGLIGRIVAVSMAREMGPFMTALILAASVGSAMAAELGTMKVSEEIDALEVMSIDPGRFLVLPRVLSMAVMTPVVTIYIVLVGTLGGAASAYFQYDISFERFRTDALEYLTLKDIYTGILKAFIFGTVISIVGCSEGLRARGGAIGVGSATRQSVVISYLLIIVLGYYVTFTFYYIEW